MSLWFLLTILCGAAAVGVAIPLLRRFEDVSAGGEDKVIYEDQLKEVEKDFQNGAINGPEADSAKVEIQRRLAKSGKNIIATRPLSTAWRNAAVIATSALVILGSLGLYSIIGNPNLPSSVASAASSNSGLVDDMVAKLAARLKAAPNDADGWRMLGWAQFNLQHYSESADAYFKASALDPLNTDYKSAYAEALVQMAQGVVTPKAQEVIADLLAKSPKDSRGRFYEALSHEQSGDLSGALDRWLALLADTPADASWRDEVKQRIADLAKATSRDVSAAIALPEGDQKDLIKSMVEGLAGKLAVNPNDVEGWLRLMRSYQVLNEPAKAKEALAKAMATFASDAATTAKLNSAAIELGIN